MSCSVGLQTQLEFLVAMAVVQAGSCSSDSISAWELPYATGAALKKKEKERKKERNSVFDKLMVIIQEEECSHQADIESFK